MTTKTENKETQLGEFDWENGGEVDFFESTESIVEPKEKEEEEETEEESKKEEEVEEEEEVDDNFFEEVKDDKTKTPKETDEEVVTGGFISTLETLKSKGLIDFELEEGEELTEDLAEEIVIESIEQKVDDKIKSMFGELPEEAVAFNKFVLSGGDPQEFFEKYNANLSTGINPKMDLSEKNNQIKIITHQLQADGYDADYIETQLEYLEDAGKLEKIAEVHFNKWKKSYDESQKSLVKNREEQTRIEKETRKQLKNKISTYLSDKVEIKGLKINPKDKRELPAYMYEKSVKLANGAEVSQMQKELYENLQKEENATVIAMLLRSGFDLSSIKKAVETEVTNKTRNEVRRKSQNMPSKTGGSSQKIGSLAELFN